MVTFGISPECLCHDVRDNVRRVRDLEEAGFDYIWEGDHTLPWQHSSGHSAGIWATLAAFLANTSHAVVGPMVIPPIGIRHHPVDVAIAYANRAVTHMLHELFDRLGIIVEFPEIAVAERGPFRWVVAEPLPQRCARSNVFEPQIDPG